MKRKLLILISAALLIHISAVAQFAGGAGTKANPYQVATADQLNSIRSYLSNHFVQTADIDLSGYPNWIPIGNSTTKFTGSFDGGSYTISNLTILQETYSSNIGLFGYFQPATVGDYIKNVTINNVSINTVGQSIGAVVGYCYYATIHNCSMNGDIYGSSSIGGIVGGAVYSVTISNCYADVTINAQYGNNGGIVGNMRNANCSISKCFAKGTINGSNQYNGGIVGSFGMDSFGTIENCYSSVDVISDLNSIYSGGIAGGILNGNKTIKNCFSTGIVQAASSAGGISGNVYNATVKNCFSANTRVNVLSTNQWAYVGRIGADNFASTYTSNYAWEDIYVNNEKITDGTLTNINGANITLSQIQTEAFYTNVENWADEAWDFGSTWAINLSISPYPILNNIPTAFQTIKHSQGIFWAVPYALGINQTIENPVLGGLNAIAYESSNPSVIEVVGSSLITHSAGTANITASIAESEFYAANSITQTFTVYQNGTGTKEDPFLISTVEELNSIRNNLSMHFRLANNLDLGVAPWNEGEGWEPIGKEYNNSFTGSFDGNGFTISNLFIDRPDQDFVGLFGYYVPFIEYDSLKNITIDNADITGKYSVGAIVGVSEVGNIFNCHSSGNVKSTNWSAGGIVGSLDPGNIYSSTSSCSVSADGNNSGGIAGFLSGIASDCNFSGTVTGNENNGGIAGEARYSSTTITDCQNEGAISGNINTGGIVGLSFEGSQISNSSNNGQVTGAIMVGGIVGKILDDATINNCHNTGTVNASGEYVGGIAGKIENSTTITSCSNSGSIGNGSANYLGGIAGGAFDSEIFDSENSGIVSGNNHIGGIVGYSYDSHLEACQSSGFVSGNSNIGGIVGSMNTTMKSTFPLSITNCHSTANVKGTGEKVGGIVGYGGDLMISKCSSKGNISGSSKVGGIVGQIDFYGEITQSFSAGSIKGYKSGGIAGEINGNSINSTLIKNNYSTAKIEGDGNYSGGIIGSGYYLTIANCYSSGEIDRGYGIIGAIDEKNPYNGLITNTISINAKISGGNRISSEHRNLNNNYAWDEMYVNDQKILDGTINNKNGLNVSLANLSAEFFTSAENWDTEGWDFGNVWTFNSQISPYPILKEIDTETQKVQHSQSITWTQELPNSLIPEPLELTADGGVNRPITYTSSNPAVASIDGNTMTVHAAGSAEITATIAGSEFYAPASMTRELIVYEGDGTPENPYLISNLQQLNGVRNNLSAHYKLIADIDLSSIENWEPIGTDFEPAFRGSFDGGGHTISNLTIIRPNDDYIGLFGFYLPYEDYFSITDINVMNVNIIGDEYVGAVVGFVDYGSITKCNSSGEVKATYGAGGITGYLNSGDIIECSSSCNVEVFDGWAGGIVGEFMEGEIVSCISTGNISGYTIGGIVGQAYNVVITLCSTSGKIHAKNDRAGGIAGNVYNATTISYCNSQCDVFGNYSELGGIAGTIGGGDIINCYSTGSIKGLRYIGGIAGFITNGSTITGCYNTAKVFGTENSIGGIAGYIINSTITGCYNTAEVFGTESSIGGIAGFATQTVVIEKSFNHGNVTGSTSIGGIVGAGDNAVTVSACYSTGEVAGNYTAGGIAGDLSSTSAVIGCYSTGIIKNLGNESGGIVGYLASSSISNSFAANAWLNGGTNHARIAGLLASSTTLSNNYAWDDMYLGNSKITDGTTSNKNGENTTFAELSNNTGGFILSAPWDFDDVWTFDHTKSPYPILQGIDAEVQAFKHAQHIIWEDDLTGLAVTDVVPLTAVGGATGSTIIFSSDDVGVANITGDELTVTGAGGTFITASIAESQFFAAASVMKSLVVWDTDGTVGDPHEIWNLAQLDGVRNDLNVHYKLMADIDMSLIANWEPIGDSSNPFMGKLYGNDHTLSHLTINKPFQSELGLFGGIENAFIEKLNITNASISGKGKIGVIVGFAKNSTITSCHSSGTIQGSGYDVGGIVGQSDGSSISLSSSSCNISDFEGDAGGIVGYLVVSTIEDCWFVGSILNIDNSAGGIVGYPENSIVSRCFNAGTVSGRLGIGGIVGQDSESEIANCYNTGSIYGTDSDVGGIGGNGNSNVYYSYNTGSVNSNGYWVGGIYGSYYEATAKNNVSIASKVISNGDETNRLNGFNSNNILANNYAWTDIYVNSSKVTTGTLTNANGQNATLEQLKSAAFYTDDNNWDDVAWDFADTWVMNPAVSPYPILKNIPEEVQKVQHTQVMTNAWTQVLPLDATIEDVIELTAPSEGPSEEIEYVSSNPAVATINGNQLTAVGLGSAIITVRYPETEFYSQSNGFSKTFAVTNKLGQNIDWDQTLTATYGDNPIVLTAVASSGLDVTYSSGNEDVGVVIGNDLIIVGAGTAIITASQSGNEIYAAAENLSLTLVVSKAMLTITANNSEKVYGDADPDFSVTYEGFVADDDETSLDGTLEFSRETGETVGEYDITPFGLLSDNYEISYEDGILSITAKELTIGGSFTVFDKEYDGTTSATIDDNNLTLLTVLSGDVVELSAVVAEFENAAVGEDKTVTIVSAELTGADKDNYSLSLAGAPTTTATITAPSVVEYTLTITIVGNGTVKVDGELYTTAITVEEGTILDLEAIADEGWEFASWTGDVADANVAITTITMNSDKNITATFTKEVSVSIVNAFDITLYPNPTKGNFNIVSEEVITEVRIFDIAGKMVYSQTHEGKAVDISINDVEPGMYFVRITTLSGDRIMKLQIAK